MWKNPVSFLFLLISFIFLSIWLSRRLQRNPIFLFLASSLLPLHPSKMQPQKQQLPQVADVASGGRPRASGFALEDAASAVAQPRETDRAAAIEMDFFSSEKRMRMPAPSRAPPAAAQLLDHRHLDFKVPALGLAREDVAAVNTGLHLANARSDNQSLTVDDTMSISIDYAKEDRDESAQLAAIQAEMHLINEENQRLRLMIDEMNAKYNTLQKLLLALQHSNPSSSSSINQHEALVVPRQFIDLGESSNSSTQRSHNSDHQFASTNNVNREATTLDLENSSREGEDRWSPSRAPKLSPPVSSITTEQALQDSAVQRARVSVRVRTEAPTVPDGCQWRKYGQKVAKGNPCPRAYFRCTMADRCPVRKKVQRCAEDTSILISTYEGSHNHPLPPAAMVMATTTTSAASMLTTGSMPSGGGDRMMNTSMLAKTLLPCSPTVATVSASASFPTVTLDLTQNPNPLHLHRQPPPGAQLQEPFLSQPPPQVFGQVLQNQSLFADLQMSPEMTAQLANPPSVADNVAAVKKDPNFNAVLYHIISNLMERDRGGAGGSRQAGNTSSANGDGGGKNLNSDFQLSDSQ